MQCTPIGCLTSDETWEIALKTHYYYILIKFSHPILALTRIKMSKEKR